MLQKIKSLIAGWHVRRWHREFDRGYEFGKRMIKNHNNTPAQIKEWLKDSQGPWHQGVRQAAEMWDAETD